MSASCRATAARSPSCPTATTTAAPTAPCRVAGDLYSPNNVTFRPIGFGTVFASGRWVRSRSTPTRRATSSYSQSAVLVPGLPDDGRHKTKTVAYGPDGLLYVSVGSFDDNPDPRRPPRRDLAL